MKNLPFVSIGDNTSRVFGLSPRDRANRFAAKADMIAVAEIPTDGPFVVANLGYAWDPAWLQHVASHPGLVLTTNGVPALANPIGRASCGERLCTYVEISVVA